jgi:hypothetical protein
MIMRPYGCPWTSPQVTGRADFWHPTAGREHPPALGANVRVMRRDWLGGLIHEYTQVA